jgi:O-antigen ligase
MAVKKKPMKQKPKQVELVEKLDRWVFYLFLVILAAVPLVFARIFPFSAAITFDQFDIEKVITLRILTVFLFGLWSWKMFASRTKEIRWSYLDFLVAGFILLAFIATLTSMHIPTAIHGKFKRYEGLLTFVNYAVLYFIGIQTFTNTKRLDYIGKTMTFTGAIVALYGVMQYFGHDPFEWAKLPFEERRSFSSFGNPDLLAGYLVLLLPFTIAEFIKTKQIKDKTARILYDGLLLGVCGLSFLCLLLAAVRGAWIASIVALIVLIAISLKSFVSHPVKSGIFVGLFVIVFATVAVWSASAGTGVLNLMERIKTTTKLDQGSAKSRLDIWTAGINMIKDKPLFGNGPDTFRLNSERYETEAYVKDNQGRTVADNAHCYPIQLASGIGIPATLLFIVLVFWALYSALAKFKGNYDGDNEEKITLATVAATKDQTAKNQLQKQLDERLIINAIVASVFGYFVHLLFGVSITGSTAVLWVLLPALFGATTMVKKMELKSNGAMVLTGATVVASVIVIMSAVFASTMYYADYCYAAAISYSNTGNQLAASDKNVNAGVMQYFDEADKLYQQALSYYKNGRYFDGYGNFLDNLGMNLNDVKYTNEAVKVFTDGVNFEPMEADHYMYLGMARLRQVNDSSDPTFKETMDLLRRGIKARPRNPVAHMLMGNAYYINGDYRGAITELELSLVYDPNNVSTIELLAKVYKTIGDTGKAKELYERALIVEPDKESLKEGLAQIGNK